MPRTPLRAASAILLTLAALTVPAAPGAYAVPAVPAAPGAYAVPAVPAVPAHAASADETAPVAVTVNARAALAQVPETGIGTNHAIWDSRLGTDETADLLKDAGMKL